MNKENVVYTHTRDYYSSVKTMKSWSWQQMDGIGVHSAEWNKPGPEKTGLWSSQRRQDTSRYWWFNDNTCLNKTLLTLNALVWLWACENTPVVFKDLYLQNPPQALQSYVLSLQWICWCRASMYLQLKVPTSATFATLSTLSVADFIVQKFVSGTEAILHLPHW